MEEIWNIGGIEGKLNEEVREKLKWRSWKGFGLEK